MQSCIDNCTTQDPGTIVDESDPKSKKCVITACGHIDPNCATCSRVNMCYSCKN